MRKIPLVIGREDGDNIQDADGTVIFDEDGAKKAVLAATATIALDTEKVGTLTPSHQPVFAGESAWTGGLVTLAVTVTGVLATDIVLCNFYTIGTEGTVIAAVATANTITFTLDTANTTNDAVVSYQVLRATA